MLFSRSEFFDVVNLDCLFVLTKDYLARFELPKAHNELLDRNLTVVLLASNPSELVYELIRLLLNVDSVPKVLYQRIFEKLDPFLGTIFSKSLFELFSLFSIFSRSNLFYCTWK